MNTLIKGAQEFAHKAHIGQMYDQFPYFKHLQDVYNILNEFGYTVDKGHLALNIASWFHDILEDTATSYSDIKRFLIDSGASKELAEEVAEIVYCMTDEMGRNRKEKKEKTLPKIRSNYDSIILKLCDRIANVRNSRDTKGEGFSSMYAKEHKNFRCMLHIPGHCDALWAELDSLMKNG